MNEHDLEQAFREWAAADAEVQEPTRLRRRVMSVPDGTVSGSRWRWPSLAAWLRSRPVPVTASAAAVLVLFTMVLVPLLLAGPTDEEAPATTQGSIVVAADGSGQYRTIAEAVEAAKDGDTILVNPGSYVESLVITKSITISGDGPREAIIVEAPDDGPVAATGEAGYVNSVDEPYAIHLINSTARLEGLTIRGQRSRVQVSGGTPTLERLLFEDVGVVHRLTEPSAGGNALIINGGSRAIVRDNDLRGGGPIGIFDGSEPLIEGNRLSEGPNIWGSPGDAAIIRSNTFEGTEGGAIKIFGPLPGAALIEGNTIKRSTGPGIVVGYQGRTGFLEPSQRLTPTIRRNVVSGAETAIRIGGEQVTAAVTDNLLSGNAEGIFFSTRAVGSVSGNRLTDNKTGVRISGDVVVEDNSIEGGSVGVLVGAGQPIIRTNQIAGSRVAAISALGGATPTLGSNEIDGNEIGILVDGPATKPVMTDNQLCDNGSDLELRGGAVADLENNRICLVVARDGSGDAPTIAGAVEMASDGDTIVVMPGTYQESIVIDRDITLRGVGDRDEIIIESPSELPAGPDTRADLPFALRLIDTRATVSNLTFRGPASAIDILGGSPWLENIAILDVGVRATTQSMTTQRPVGLSIGEGSTAELHGSLVRGADVIIAGASGPVLEDNDFEGSMIQFGEAWRGERVGDSEVPDVLRSDALIKGNIFRQAWTAIWVGQGMSARIEDNEIMNAESTALFLGYVGPDTMVLRNIIRDSETAIMVVQGEPISIDQNEISDSRAGMVLSGSGSTLRVNVVRGNQVGIVINPADDGASPTLLDNTIENNGRGLAIMAGTDPTLSGNVICDNETNVIVIEGADVSLLGDQICANVASAQ